MEFEVFVCDSKKYLKQLMSINFNAYAVFMTIRTYNKYLKEFPDLIIKKDGITFIKLEGNEYKVTRVKDDNILLC